MTTRAGDADQIGSYVGEYAKLGLDHLTVNVVYPPGPRGVERLGSIVETLRKA